MDVKQSISETPSQDFSEDDEFAEQSAERLTAKLRELNIDPDELV